MNIDAHERARKLIAWSGPAWSGPEELAPADQTWLAAHMEGCASCPRFADNARQTINALRAIPIAAERSLVSTTQMKVRRRALELQRQRERLWVVCACCAAVTLSTTVTTSLLWLGFEWIGKLARFSAPVWEGGFLMFCLMPTVLTGVLLLARGTFLADHNGSSPD